MKILCATDLLPKSESALERAAMLAESQEAQLVLIHVLPEPEPHHLLEQERQRAGRQLRLRATPPQWRHRIVPTFEVRSGNPVQVLIQAARDLEPAVIVFGSNRPRFICDTLAGTIAARVLKQVDCPVLVVRRMPWSAYHRVLLLLDRAGSSEMVDAVARLVLHGRPNAALTKARESFCAGAAGETWDSPATDIERPQIITEPCGYSSAVPTPDLQVAMMHERSTMTNLIHRYDGRLSPDLLVVGTGRRGWVRRMFLRDPVSGLLATRDSDLLIVPRRGECTAPRRKSSGLGTRHWWKQLCARRLTVQFPGRLAGPVREPTRSVSKVTREVYQ